ncbi:MAG: TRAP transporter small permease [Dehalococcoidia bacterium]|nr:TRAP transporter small permease [Dehalococcoidia bacterium]
MFTRAAKYMNKVISYPSNLLAAAAMVAMVFMMLAVSADVFMRFVFRSPILGIWDLSTLAYVVIVWGPMAMAAIKGSHIMLTFLVERMPRLPRLGLELVISLVTTGMLGMVSWRLLIHAMDMGAKQTLTAVLRIPYEPLGYFAAFACAIMALAFLARFPEIVGKSRKEQ